MANKQISNQTPIANHKIQYKFNLELRTTRFSINILTLCSKLPTSITIKPLIDQLVRSATSIGANYREANGCDSKKDFKNKLSICKKEAKETMYWIELLGQLLTKQQVELRVLWKESHELSLIFAAIIRKLT